VKIAVLGGTLFIGRAVVEDLAAGLHIEHPHEVAAIEAPGEHVGAAERIDRLASGPRSAPA